MIITKQLKLFQNSLPKKPYCTNELASGLRIRSASSAISHKYIQPNHPNSKLWLLFDIDRPTAPEELTDDLLLPAPTIFIQNPKNRHAHALYALETAVHLNSGSSYKAMRFAAAVDVSLSNAMNADAGYAGLICKNPLHEAWRTYAIGDSYDLHELAEYVDLSAWNNPRKHLPEVGLGRNCTLFDKTRVWAYKAIRANYGISYNAWLDEVFTQALCYNTGFDAPLPISEIKATAKSIAKYTLTHFSPEAFSAIQSARGKKGGRPSKPNDISNLKPWESMGVSRATYYRRK